MVKQILIVEDEPKIAQLLRDYLQAEGYTTQILDRGDGVADWVRSHAVDLVLLDLMLPGCSGLEVCKRIREFSALPIVMVTARVEEIDRLLGLELGADDYICKPFSPREVVARVKAVLRRTAPGSEPARQRLQLDDDSYRASIDGTDLGLTAVEYQLLKILANRPGKIFSRDQLIDAMYNDRRVVEDRTVDSHIKKLRKKIANLLPDREIVHSVYGVGYRYEFPQSNG